jgi:NAD(P)-dependent dehydrogenase (short-subunit alcohol dehydrogenase family)
MKHVVVSGADRNIGLEITRQFLQRGWQVYAGRYATDLTLLDELKAEYPKQLSIVMMDVTSEESVRAAAAEIQKITPVIDMLVHNAASLAGHVGKIKGEVNFGTDYTLPYDVNALGAIRMVQAFLPLMQEGDKRLCFVSSEAGIISVAHREALSGYGMSKTALNMALRLMFEKLQPMGYQFRIYHPGWTVKGHLERGVGKYEPQETAESAVSQFIEDRDWEDRLIMVDVEHRAWSY